MNASTLANRAEGALTAAARCEARAVVAFVIGDAREARKELAEARSLVGTARDCARVIDDEETREACARADMLLGVLAVAVGR